MPGQGDRRRPEPHPAQPGILLWRLQVLLRLQQQAGRLRGRRSLPEKAAAETDPGPARRPQPGVPPPSHAGQARRHAGEPRRAASIPEPLQEGKTQLSCLRCRVMSVHQSLRGILSMPSVLFVCMANRFRSPLAAAFFRQRLAGDGRWRTPGRSPAPGCGPSRACRCRSRSGNCTTVWAGPFRPPLAAGGPRTACRS